MALVFNKEMNSLPGRVNLCSEILLFLLIGFVIVLGSIIPETIVNILNAINGYEIEIDYSHIIKMILIFLAAFVICLCFMCVVIWQENKFDKKDKS